MMRKQGYETLKKEGNAFLANKKFEQALACYQKALAMDKNNPEAYKNIGNVYSATDQHEKAAEYYLLALEKDKTYFPACHNLGVAYKTLKNYEKSIEYFDRALTLNGRSLTTIKSLASTYSLAGRFELAEKLFEHAISIEPSNVETQLVLLNHYFYSKQRSKAITYIPQIKVKITDDVFLFRSLVAIVFEAGEFETALNLLSEREDAFSKFEWFHFNMANVYKALKQYENVAKHYEIAYSINPELGYDASLEIATFYEVIENRERALFFYTLALEKNPSSALVLCRMGYEYRSRQDHRGAISYFEKALRHCASDPLMRPGHINGLLAQAHLELQDYPKAKSYCEQAIACGDGNEQYAYWMLVKIYELEGNFELAEEARKKLN